MTTQEIYQLATSFSLLCLTFVIWRISKHVAETDKTIAALTNLVIINNMRTQYERYPTNENRDRLIEMIGLEHNSDNCATCATNGH